MVTDASTTVNVVGVDADMDLTDQKLKTKRNFLLSKQRKNYLCKEPHPNARVDGMGWAELDVQSPPLVSSGLFPVMFHYKIN